MFRSNFDDFSKPKTPPKQVMSKIGPGWLRFAPEIYPYDLGCNSYHFRQYGWKMFQLNFDDFFRSEHYRSGWSWKPGQMTRFCTQNIPTMFLSLPLRTAEKSFDQILATFSGPNTTEGKVKNWTRMTRFCTQNIPTLFGVQFLLFPVSTTKKNFGRIWWHFRARTPIEHA